MNVPFCRPLIDQQVIDEVTDCLTNTGWLTSGPKVLALEAEIKRLSNVPEVVCVNSWTSGAKLMLRWFGVGPGDEVIIPAYTYAATALCAIHLGADVVMVDVRDDFNLDPEKLRRAISPRTKAIIPVDVGGWPADYSAIQEVLQAPDIQALFQTATPEQAQLGRILVLADAAHAIGALYRGKPAVQFADAAVYSFHSVKNITTGEGGAIALHLPPPFDNAELYRFLKILSLNGQTKSAFEKNQPGAWRYDIVAAGLKANMPDLCAAVGLAQIRRYQDQLLPERLAIFQQYCDGLGDLESFILPPWRDDTNSCSAAHLFMLRVKNISEKDRDALIVKLAEHGVGVNVHYTPLPMLTLFKNMGFQISDYPMAYQLYQGEISLPIYNGLTPAQVEYVVEQVRRWCK